MTDIFTAPVLTGYNASPPADDGTEVAANRMDWAKHKTKIADPNKTFLDDLNTNALTAFGKLLFNSISAKTGNYTILSTDIGKVISVTNETTITLIAAATAGKLFPLCIYNAGTDLVTVDGNASETINSSLTIVLRPGEMLIPYSDDTNWLGHKSFVDDKIFCAFPDYGDFSGNLTGGRLIFPWSAPAKLADPSTVPTGIGRGCVFSSNEEFLVFAHDTTPFVTIYQRSGPSFNKLANPATLPAGQSNDAGFSPSGEFLALAHSVTPFVTIYQRSGPTFTKLSNPASLPAGIGFTPAFPPNGEFLAVSHATSPFITIYQRDGTTFTKLANPATLPAGAGRDCVWSPNGEFLAVVHTTTPFVTIYQRSGTTFTKLADPATLPTGGNGCAWSPSGEFLAIAHGNSPFITIYQRDGTTFTKLANPATLPTGIGNNCSWHPSGVYLVVAHNTSPFITIYQRDGTTFTKLANPATLPANHGEGCSFSPSGEFLALAVNVTSPYMAIYQTASDMPAEGVLVMAGFKR